MWSFLGLVAITTLILVVVFVGLVLLRAPVYRLEKENLICLFEMALSGQANEEDWEVFISVPIRYDEKLEKIRLECEILTENKAVYVDSQRRLCMDETGQQSLRMLLESLSNPDER